MRLAIYEGTVAGLNCVSVSVALVKDVAQRKSQTSDKEMRRTALD